MGVNIDLNENGEDYYRKKGQAIDAAAREFIDRNFPSDDPNLATTVKARFTMDHIRGAAMVGFVWGATWTPPSDLVMAEIKHGAENS